MRDNSLPKSTILKTSEFHNVFRNGQLVKNEFFSIFFVKENVLKVGFAAPKKCGSKPIRNKLKRIGRELWRTNFRNYDLPAHFVIVIQTSVLALNHKKREDVFSSLLHDIQDVLRITIIPE